MHSELLSRKIVRVVSEMMKRIVREVVRYSVVYATTGVVGLGVMAWMAYRARRSPSDASAATIDDSTELPLAA